MIESENLLIIAINQLGCLPKDTEIKSINQITNDNFAKILLKICKKIITLKGFEFTLPELLSIDMNSKYRECQKLVDFIKYLGYKADLNLNNILFPSTKDIQRVFEYTLEYITNSDSGVLDFDENISEKQFAKAKLSKALSTWTKETWLVPGLTESTSKNEIIPISILNKSKFEKINKKFSKFKNLIPEKLSAIAKNKTNELFNDEYVNLALEEDYTVRGWTNSKPSDLRISDLKAKNKTEVEKTVNQHFVELLATRDDTLKWLKNNYYENSFMNNIKIIENKNKLTYNIYKDDNYSSKTNQEQNVTESTEEDNSKNAYLKKIDNILLSYEKEKEGLNIEISDLNEHIQRIAKLIDIEQNKLNLNETKIQELNLSVMNLSTQNEDIIKAIEEKLETFEQINKTNKSEVKDDAIINEVASLEKKYEEMITNWEEYSSQAKSRIDELKNNVESKKKEYNFKYEKIGLLKKEIEEISSKIGLKQELANFLNEEYQKIPMDVNRNKFITKISELTTSISKEKNHIGNYLNDLKSLGTQITNINETIRRVDNELEDKLFQDVKSNSSAKDLYAMFIKVREGYNVIQKNIIDTQISKNKLKEISNKVDDYQFKLKSYDYNQLKEQVDLLRLENNKK